MGYVAGGILLLVLVQLPEILGPHFHFPPIWPELAWTKGFLESLSSFAGDTAQ